MKSEEEKNQSYSEALCWAVLALGPVELVPLLLSLPSSHHHEQESASSNIISYYGGKLHLRTNGVWQIMACTQVKCLSLNPILTPWHQAGHFLFIFIFLEKPEQIIAVLVA